MQSIHPANCRHHKVVSQSQTHRQKQISRRFFTRNPYPQWHSDQSERKHRKTHGELFVKRHFGFVINNLLNREYMTRPATMMSPRTFAFQINFKI